MSDKPKDSFYFSHDSNARNDIKIVKLRRKHGMRGYGCYWCIIEILREDSDHKLPLSDIDDIAFQIGETAEFVNDVLKSFGLFQITEGEFFSTRLIRSMDQYNGIKSKLSDAGKKGMQKRWGPQDQQTAPKLRRAE